MSNNFNPGFDREKAAFLELANRGDGLTPIDYLYAKEASFGSVLSSAITGGTAEFYTIYVNGIESSNITNSNDIITSTLKLSNPSNDYYVGFTAGSLTQSTIWSLPLQDGTDGQVLATNGNRILSFIDAGGGGEGAPKDATYIIRQENEALTNAQVLSSLETGIAKIETEGYIAIAVPDVDYATVETLEELAAEAEASAEAAATSATEATGAAAEATGAASEAIASAIAASASAAAAAASAAAASDYSDKAYEYKEKAREYKNDAFDYKESASNSASSASSSASNASSSASEAHTYLETLLSTGLNQLPNSGDVDINNYKIINLANGISGTDAVNVNQLSAAISGSAAPNTATYIIQTANSSLTNAQVLGSLSTGLLKNTTTTGVLSIATAGTDYYSPGNPTTIKDDGDNFFIGSDIGNVFPGSFNLGIGTGVLQSTTVDGYQNLGIGAYSLTLNTIGINNIGIGAYSLTSNTIGINNIAIGFECLFTNTVGNYNIGIGHLALNGNTTGSYNIGIGDNTSLGNRSRSVAIGYYALHNATNFSDNTAIGYQAGGLFSANSRCVFIGSSADTSVDNLTNVIAIGYNTKVSTSNAMCLGNGVNVGINQASPAYPLHISNVSNISALYLEATTSTPSIPTSGGLMYTSGGELYYKGNSKTVQLSAVPIPLSNGGTNASLTASNGGIVYSTASALAILSGTATAGQILRSGASAAPSWSTATYPATTTVNQILYSSTANTITGLTTGNSSILATNGSGVPSLTTTLPFTVPVTTGGTGLTSTTAYGVLCGGTTSTGNFQNAGTGTSGQVYVSGGASAVGSWQSITSAGGAPNTATYIVQTSNASLTNAQVLGSLSTGLLKNTTSTGVLTIGVAGTDYYSAGNPTTIRDNGNNFFIGTNAGNGTLTATNNTGIGVYVLNALTSNGNCTAVGFNALKVNTGANNTAIGSGALDANTAGARNTAVGGSALGANTTANDNTALGYQALLVNTGANNTAIGSGALDANTAGARNTAVGGSALGANIIGNNCTAIGFQALLVNTANDNIAVGYNALVSNTTGEYNLAIGGNSLETNTTASSNIAIGYFSLNRNETGGFNTAIGVSALSYNTTGHDNTTIGYQSLYSNLTGERNLAIGNNSLYSNTTGSSNCIIGDYAANTLNGDENVIIGTDAGILRSSLNLCVLIGTGTSATNGIQNATAIGHSAQVNTSNSMVLGNGVNVGIGTSSPAYKLDVDSGQINAPSGLTPATQLLGRCMLSSSNTTISTANNTWIALAFNGTNQTTYDPSNWHSNSTNNTRITPGVVGTYRLTGSLRFNNSGGGVACGIGFGINGSNPTNDMQGWFTRDSTTGRRSATFTVIDNTTAVTDFFELQAQQDSGGTLTLQGFHFQVERLV